MIRHDWSLEEIRLVHDLPLPELLYRAQTVHRAHHDPEAVQGCALLSIKTGLCPEDCAYCPQSAHYETGLGAQPLLSVEDTLSAARNAKAHGATRFCMGAAWRQAPDGPEFDQVIEMVRGVRELGMEACCTLGMLTQDQADRLAEAGLTAYNHNLDTSPEFYGEIITTRSYQDRLDTLARVRRSGVTVCCGGIVGLGESVDDRLGLILQLARQDPPPRERAHQQPCPDGWDASCRAGACGSSGIREDRGDSQDRDAIIHRATVGGTPRTLGGRASTLLSGRSQLDFSGRTLAHDSEPHLQRGRGTALENGNAALRAAIDDRQWLPFLAPATARTGRRRPNGWR